jgi:hypothetical protein
MNPLIDRLKILFLGLFVVACAVVAVGQVVWLDPQKRCELRGAWWDPSSRICATPIAISKLTGRPNGSPPVTPGLKPR